MFIIGWTCSQLEGFLSLTILVAAYKDILVSSQLQLYVYMDMQLSCVQWASPYRVNRLVLNYLCQSVTKLFTSHQYWNG